MLFILLLLGSVDCYLMNNPEPPSSEHTLAEQVQMLMEQVIHLQNDVTDLKNASFIADFQIRLNSLCT